MSDNVSNAKPTDRHPWAFCFSFKGIDRKFSGERSVTKGWMFIGGLAIVLVLTTLWAVSVQPAREESRPSAQREEAQVDWPAEYERLRTFPASVWEAMQNADLYVAMSIDPAGASGASSSPTSSDSLDVPSVLHGHAVLGRVVVTETRTRETLNASIRTGVEGWDGAASGCTFQPRHAVRIVRGDRVIDIVICYRCGDVYIHDSDAQDAERRYIVCEVPEVFTELFAAANIQVSD